jgi:hypothetical protein
MTIIYATILAAGIVAIFACLIWGLFACFDVYRMQRQQARLNAHYARAFRDVLDSDAERARLREQVGEALDAAGLRKKQEGE